MNFLYVKDFESYRLVDRHRPYIQTEPTAIINHAASQVVDELI